MRPLLLLLALLGPIQDIDTQIQQAVQEHRAGWLERPMRAATDVGKPVVVVGMLLGIAVLDAAEGVTLARVALVAAAAVNLVVEATKWATNRTRPDGDHKRSNASFPSSHAANAFALAVLFARRWRRGAPAFLGLALIVAISRVYLNRHYASDVVFGALLGAAIALAVARLMQWRVGEPRASARAPSAPASG
jgi:undecaprenyl-diphosphatase